MHRRTARGNRLGLALTGLLLAVAGAALFAANRGYFGSASADHAVYPSAARKFVHANGSWLWGVVAAVAIIVGLVFLRWLLVQPRTDRLRRLVIDSDPEDGDAAGTGRTKMPAHAMTDVVEDDIVDLRGVRRASAVLSGHSDAPELWLTVYTDANADVSRIRSAITGSVVADARTSLELPELPTYVKVHVTRRDGGREIT